MKTVTAILVFLLSSSLAQAAEWKNQYLANTGGSHLIIVPWEERQTTEAYIEDNGTRLRIGCYKEPRGNSEQRYSFARVGNGEPFAGREMILIAKFDQLYEYRLGKFGYSGGSYYGTIGPQVLAMLATANTVAITDEKSDFMIEFILHGAVAAIKNIECNGEIA